MSHRLSFPLYLIAENVRSAYNIGALFRLADCAGVQKLYLTGISPYPQKIIDDNRKPWEIESAHQKIHKTALGAEESVQWEYVAKSEEVISELRAQDVLIVALETGQNTVNIYEADLKFPLAIVVGAEVTGVTTQSLSLVDFVISIPQFGSKESLNVTSAAAVAVYECVRRLL